MRRAAVAGAFAAAALAGCGVLSGLGEDFASPPSLDDAGADATVPGADGALGADAPAGDDVRIPDDVFYADALDEPPPPLEAGCRNPSSCASSKCCDPAVCNATNACVGKCVGKHSGCGNEGACCQGLHCGEYKSCVTSCVGKAGDPCNGQGSCCLGLACPPETNATCQECKPQYAGCNGSWECCGKVCGFPLRICL